LLILERSFNNCKKIIG